MKPIYAWFLTLVLGYSIVLGLVLVCLTLADHLLHPR